ncbi:MAG: type VI secretion system Vgr family protein [Deltaproteobacteria bacterium]|jgi:type VI secretion system VgrG family protein|nr:type VI secretion system Vgr family protein [Deltaproteobacteria bacterium]
MTRSLAVDIFLSLPNFPQLKIEPVQIEGSTALNALYQINITTLIAQNDLNYINTAKLLNSPAHLTISARDIGDTRNSSLTIETLRADSELAPLNQGSFRGLIISFEIGEPIGELIFCSFTLGPSLALLADQRQNRVHLDLDCLSIIKDSFKFGALPADLYRFKAKSANYPNREFTLQYDEALLDFVFRIMEREGLGLYFEPSEAGDCAVICSQIEHYPPITEKGEEVKFTYLTQSSLTPEINLKAIFNLSLELRRVPKKITLKDYNWSQPNRTLETSLEVSPSGQGEVYLYGENFDSDTEGLRLAKIRREEFLAHAQIFQALALAPGLRAGLTFNLTNYPLKNLNVSYLVTKSSFRAARLGSLSGQIGSELGQDEGFSQTIGFIPASTIFRPSRTLAPKKIDSTLTAFIDGPGTGGTPQIDSLGRYKVILPLDVSGRSNGAASSWLRLARPFAGRDYGQHFPLSPGAEVLLTFIDGNPDRPVILTTLPNAEAVNLLNSSSSQLSGLASQGGSALMFSDEEENQKAALTLGSNRGSILLTANSPTNFSVHTDQVNVLTNYSTNMIGGASIEAAGFSNILEANEDKRFDFVTQALASLDVITEATSTAAIPNDKSTAAAPPINEKVAAVSDCLHGLFDDIYGVTIPLKILSNIQSVEPALLPHDNLLNLRAHPGGSRALFQTSEKSPSILTKGLAVLTALNRIVSSSAYVVENTQEILNQNDPNFDKSTTSTPPDPSIKNYKKTAAGISIGANVASILASVLSTATILFMTNKAFGPSKGLTIENLSSYLTLKALTQAGLSGQGPVIIDSLIGSLSDLLRFGVFDNSHPIELLKSETLPPNPNADYQSQKAILILTELAKTCAKEISLIAYKSLIVKARESVFIRAGVRETDIASNLSYEAEVTAIEEGEANFVPDETTPESSINSYYLTKAKFDKHKDSFGVEDNLPKGLILRSEDSNAPIIFQTKEIDSPIGIIQGNNLESEASRSVTLDNSGANLRESADMALTLSKNEQSATLSCANDLGLSLKLNGAKLYAPDSTISLEEGTISIKNSSKISLTVGPTSLEVSPTDIKINGDVFSLEAQIIKMAL